MIYHNICSGTFIERPNRFIAHVELEGQQQVVHVKNTGRCRELLTSGARVYCEAAGNPLRKTPYDLIAVEKGRRLINMDSQAPNAAVKEWLEGGGLGPVTALHPEHRHGSSRFDFAFTLQGKPCLLEVKGVTLEQEGICAFPDAPTQRGARHLQELAQAAREGYGAYVLFVIQMEDVRYLHPNDQTDPAFGQALRQAREAGVQILAMDCAVTPASMVLRSPVPVHL